MKKYGKIIISSLMLLFGGILMSCSSNSSTPTTTTTQGQNTTTVTTTTEAADADFLTFLQPGQVRIDNHAEDIIGTLKVKVNGQEATYGQAISFTGSPVFSLEGELSGEKFTIYFCYTYKDGNYSRSTVAKQMGVQASAIGRIFERYTSTAASSTKVYISISKEINDGWTKGLSAKLDAAFQPYEVKQSS